MGLRCHASGGDDILRLSEHGIALQRIRLERWNEQDGDVAPREMDDELHCDLLLDNDKRWRFHHPYRRHDSTSQRDDHQFDRDRDGWTVDTHG